MKTSLAVALAMSLFSSLFGADQKPEPSAKDTWIIAKVTKAGEVVGLYRYPTAKPKHWQSAPLSEEISITWKYEGNLPDKGLNARMVEFEDTMERLASSPDSFLSLVMTVEGTREWCYYARDYDAFMQMLNDCLTGKPRFPIAIEHSHDPSWKYWHSLVDPVAKK